MNCRLLFLFIAFTASQALLAFSPINKQEAVEVGNIRQWIEMKGSDDTNPILLFLHGGPGNSSMSYGDRFTTDLQKHFVVMQWDQRASGKTAQLSAIRQQITLERMILDAAEMIRYLCKRFSKEKVYIMGHSWGGFLALEVAFQYPELLEACFAVSPMVNQLESERLSLEWMKEVATREKDTKALEELDLISVPFKSSEQLYYHRKWLAKAMGTNPPQKRFVDYWAVTWLPLFKEASNVNLSQTAPELKVPVYFFVGKRDYQTHFKVTEDYYTLLKAEKKDLFWFSKSSHNLNLTEPTKLQTIVISILMAKSKH
jgi:pimeloyl-ACP methyl ester carboxylesterase